MGSAGLFHPYDGTNGLTSCSKNLKANTFNISWTASPTTSGAGVGFNGSTQYGDTMFTPGGATHYAQNNSCFGIWITAAGSSTDFGMFSGAVNSGAWARIQRSASTSAALRANGTFDALVSVTWPSVAPGLALAAIRTGSSAAASGVDGAYVGNGSASTGLPNASFYVGAEDNGGLFFPQTCTLGCDWAASGMSSTDWTAFYNAVQTLMSGLGR